MSDGVQTPIGPRIGLDPEQLLNGPSSYIFENEDAFELDSLCSVTGVTVRVDYVMLDADLQIKHGSIFHTPNSNRTIATSRQAIGVGWLLRARAVCAVGTPLIGQCFVWLRSCRGLLSNAAVNGELASGYITANTPVFLPGAQPTKPLDEEGAARTITVGNPAAGTDWSFTVPTGARQKIVSVSAILTTSANAANRQPRLIVDDGANILFNSGAPVNETASLTWTNTWGAGASGPVTTDPSKVLNAVPNDLFLPAGFRIRTVTGAIDAADQWSAITIAVLEWLEGN
jgi:hypothetical protein